MKTIKEGSNYKIIDGEEVLATSFCGIVPETIVNKNNLMIGKNVKTIMGFYSNVKNKGFGKKLLKDIIDNEKKSKTDFLTLGVSKNNEYAIRLYSGCGFVIDGDCAGHESLHFMYIDLKHSTKN